jgi:hypothetical protein
VDDGYWWIHSREQERISVNIGTAVIILWSRPDAQTDFYWTRGKKHNWNFLINRRSIERPKGISTAICRLLVCSVITLWTPCNKSKKNKTCFFSYVVCLRSLANHSNTSQLFSSSSCNALRAQGIPGRRFLINKNSALTPRFNRHLEYSILISSLLFYF